MGRATRWLKAIFSTTTARKKDPTHHPQPEKKRGWTFSGLKGSSYREKPTSCHVSRDDDESKRSIAVAVATAAIAEAAVATAEAAAAMVRLTSRGRTYSVRGDGRREVWAAVKIQAIFRGYLARRALKALKGLVKIQALVRGHIVRKQAAETLRCMQALVRAQARVRAGRAPHVTNGTSSLHCHDPLKLEKREHCIRVNAKAERSHTLKRNGSKLKNQGGIDERTLSSWNWLDHWMDEQDRNDHYYDDKNEKILGIDVGKPRKNPRLRNRHHSMCSMLASNHNSHSLTALPDSPSKDSTIAQHSVLSSSSVEMQQHSSSPLGFPYEQDSLYSACARLGCSRSGQFTPSKSEHSHSCLSSGFSEHPNYMSYTESSRAKVRSHSAPKQRPEYDRIGSARRNPIQACGLLSASNRSFSLQLKFAEKAYPGSGRLDKMGMPTKT